MDKTVTQTLTDDDMNHFYDTVIDKYGVKRKDVIIKPKYVTTGSV